MNTRSMALRLSLPLLLVAAMASAQTVPYDLEVGYRWLDLKGSDPMYRTQINEQSGFMIRAFTYSATDFGNANVMDHFRLDASELGTGPASSLRLQFGKNDLYRFTLGYRRTRDFSANPAYANPFADQGVGISQHTYSRTRNLVDADLQFFPGGRISPFVGFSWNRWEGPGTTTYHVGQDEFLLDQSFNDRDQEIRVGSGFSVGNYYGSVTQGWRKFRTTDHTVLAPGAGAGNTGGVLGRDITAATINRNDKASGNTPFTNIFVGGQVVSRVKLVGDFVRFAADSKGNETENDTGSFASFAIGRFFNGLNEDATSRAKNTTWRGGARAEVTLTDKLDLLAGYQREHRDLDGEALINTIYLQSTTFGGGDLRDLTTVLDANNSMQRKEDLLDVAVQSRSIGPLSFRAGWSTAKQDVDLTPDLSEIVVPGSNQGGSYQRRVNTADLNGAFAKNGFILGAAYRKDSADDPIFRTDYLDRDRIRVRAGWLAPKNFIRVGVTAEQIKQDNDRSDIQYNAKFRNYLADVEVTPRDFITVRLGAGRFRTDTSIIYTRPELLVPDVSVHRENGKSYEAGLGFFVKKVNVNADAARFDNTGTTPFKIDRVRARVSYDFLARAGIAAEWSKDKYSETLLPQLSNFEASRYGIYLRYHP